MKEKSSEKPEAKTSAVDEQEIEATSTTEIQKDKLDTCWIEFIEIKKKKGKDQAVTMLKEPYTLENNTVTLTLSNEVLLNTFDKIKSDLQAYLRKALNNTGLVLEAKVTEAVAEDMIYTNKEKFLHLAKKYPALQELQEKLGLDPDY